MNTTRDAGSPWHAGEIELQRSIGAAERMDEIGRRVVRDHLIEQHRLFYPQLPFVVLGAVDANGDAWATLRAAEPGFLASSDAHHLAVRLPRDADDPADAGMNDGDALGLLGIELHTRRRNRLNGTIRRTGDDGFDIAVVQSYGNCPQYIQRRQFAFVREPNVPAPQRPHVMTALDAQARATIATADTFFVASYVDDGKRQVDVSHRGGRPGFVHVDDDGTLTIPDFSGNRFFNTLGNIVANPRAGLVFVDFDTGDVLQLTGDAQVLLDAPETTAFRGAERLWRFKPRRIVYRPEALPLRFAFDAEGWSPQSLATGQWR